MTKRTRRLLARLAETPGVDVERGLAALRGNSAKYLALLGRFVDAHAEDMTRLQACLAQGDHATAQRLAHYADAQIMPICVGNPASCMAITPTESA